MKKDLICLFPRRRGSRRPDKNWGENNWLELIDWLQEKYPQKIALCGAVGGCYFDDGIVPLGCIDLISIPVEVRMDIQLAALQRSILAIGSLSGGMRMAYASGCPCLEWGPPEEEKFVTPSKGNCWAPFLDQKYYYHPEKVPSLNKIKELIINYDKFTKTSV